ncbi:MAG: DNA starvation/stationary phase protection protein [Verrucomicrobiota bacterium]
MSSTTTTQPTQAESSVVTGLQTMLADSYALMAQTHVAHWNVEGPAFFELHTAFQSQYEELFTAIDDIAERLRALDVLAPGGLGVLKGLTSVEELDVAAMPAKDFVSHLIDAHEVVIASATAVRDACDESRDLETQDLMIGRIQVHQKTLWMFKSYLKNL